MLKINVGWSEERLAQQIAFGLSEGNLKRLKHDPANANPTGPIVIKGEDLKLENTNFVIFAAEKDPEKLAEQLAEMLDGRVDGDQPVMNIDETFYVAPVTSGDNMVWFIGLHEVSFEKLRKEEVLTFRARMIDGEGTNVEVNIFWGKTEEKMTERLKSSAR